MIRNADGRFLAGYAMNLGTCTITMAGLWSIVNERQVFKRHGFMHIEIESDSMTALSLISNGCSM